VFLGEFPGAGFGFAGQGTLLVAVFKPSRWRG
jgi:hypothetical protein